MTTVVGHNRTRLNVGRLAVACGVCATVLTMSEPAAVSDCNHTYHIVVDAHYTGNLLGTDKCIVYSDEHCMLLYVENEEDGDARECDDAYTVTRDTYAGDNCSGGCKPRSFPQDMMCDESEWISSTQVDQCDCIYEE